MQFMVMGNMSGNGSMGMDNMPNMNMSGSVNMAGHAQGMGPNNMYGTSNGFMGQSSGGFDIFSGILNFAIDVLVILLVVGLIVGLVVFLKRFMQGQGFTYNTQPGPFCSKCGQSLRSDWHCCPRCGEVSNANKASVST
jgi:hypothetical protein